MWHEYTGQVTSKAMDSVGIGCERENEKHFLTVYTHPNIDWGSDLQPRRTETSIVALVRTGSNNNGCEQCEDDFGAEIVSFVPSNGIKK